LSSLVDHEVADGIASGIATGVMSGMVSGLTSGIASSLPSGIETPDTMLNLRKGQGIESEQPRPLYQVCSWVLLVEEHWPPAWNYLTRSRG